MVRRLFGIIVGYIVMAALVFVTFTLLYLVLGVENTFEPGSYNVTITWVILSLLLSIIAAVIGGYVCTLISKDKKTTYVFAAIVFILGIVLAIPQLSKTQETSKIREGNVSNMQAMKDAKQPVSTLFLNPILGAVGILAGTKLWKEKKKKNDTEA